MIVATWRSSRAAVLLVGCIGLLALAPSPGAAAEPDSATSMYAPGNIVAIDLTLPPASRQALEDEPESDAYVEAAFSLAATDGTPQGVGPFSAPLTVGLRLKGGTGSFRPLSEKAGFKIKFSSFVKGQKFLGLKKMTLNNMVQDPSMVHETQAYRLFRALGVPAPRTGYAFLRVDGQDYGVYLNLETLDDVFLSRWFASTRHLYEADAPGTDVVPGGAGQFEVDEGDEGDRADLEALIAAADEKTGDWSDAVAPVADLAEMSRMWAVERYIGHWDGYAGAAGAFRPNNYYLHSDDTGPDAGRFRMLPWGTDQTWATRLDFDEPAGGLLFNDCLADSDCEALYSAGLTDLQAALSGLELDTQIRCTAEMLAPWQGLEDEARREYDAEEIGEGVAVARQFAAERPAELAAWLGTAAPPAAGGEPPCHPSPPGPPAAERAAQAADPGAAPAEMPTIRLRRIALDGRLLKGRVTLPEAGRVRMAAWLGEDDRGHPVCAGKGRFHVAGPATVSCPLRPAVRELLERSPRQLTLRAFFTARSGLSLIATRTLELPRR